MKTLEFAKSKELVERLVKKFDKPIDFDIDKFLKQNPHKLSIGEKFACTFGGRRLPDLFWDSGDVKGKFPAKLNICPIVREDKGNFFLGNYDFLPKFSQYLSKKNIKTLIAVGNWVDVMEVYWPKIFEISPAEIHKIYEDNCGTDAYFFNEGLTWILAFNHHSQGILAGSRAFISDFIKFYPDYVNFINDDFCANCSN